MNATPPEAKTEYSRGRQPSGGLSPGSRGGYAPLGDPIHGALFAGALLGALLLVVAEFTTLFTVHAAGSSAPVKSVSTGSHQAYAMIPIALLAAGLGYGVYRAGSGVALLAIGALGVLALLIAVLGDLPDAQANGLIGSPTTHYVTASATPSAGLYMETAGAVVLVITCGVGFLLGASPSHRLAGERPGELDGSQRSAS